MSNSPKRRSSLMLNTSLSIAAVAATLTGWAVLANQQPIASSADSASPEPIVSVAELPAIELPVLPTVVPLTRNGHRIIRVPAERAGGNGQPPNQSAPATGGGSSGNVPSQAAPQPATPRQVAPAPTAVPAPAAPAAPSRNTRSSR